MTKGVEILETNMIKTSILIFINLFFKKNKEKKKINEDNQLIYRCRILWYISLNSRIFYVYYFEDRLSNRSQDVGRDENLEPDHDVYLCAFLETFNMITDRLIVWLA